jgi:hypothetical protein
MDNQATYQHHAAGSSAEKEESWGILLPMPESSMRSKPAPPDRSTPWRSVAHENMSRNAYDPDFSDDSCQSLVAKGQPLDTVRRVYDCSSNESSSDRDMVSISEASENDIVEFPAASRAVIERCLRWAFRSTEIGKNAVRPRMMQREKPLYATQHKRMAYPHCQVQHIVKASRHRPEVAT